MHIPADHALHSEHISAQKGGCTAALRDSSNNDRERDRNIASAGRGLNAGEEKYILTAAKIRLETVGGSDGAKAVGERNAGATPHCDDKKQKSRKSSRFNSSCKPS